MPKAKYLEQNKDFKKLGLTPGVVQPFEDGRRSPVGVPGAEVWYFDAVFEDGSKFVGGFRTKAGLKASRKNDMPMMVITITMPDGTVYSDTKEYSPEESAIEFDKCDFRCGLHYVKGDLKEYDLHIEPLNHENEKLKAVDGLELTATKGVGVDLHMTAEVTPFRHKAGRAVFSKDGKKYSSWISIPKMQVEGTVTINGETKKVKGMGYHDHRCMMINDLMAWHHWLWGRQVFDDYTVVIYDLVTAKKYGYVRFPLLGVYNKDGELIYDNSTDMQGEYLEMSYEEKSRKEYPKETQYKFNIDGKDFTYTLRWKDILEVREMYYSMKPPIRLLFKAMGIQLSYNRYFSDGKLEIQDGGKTKVYEGDMIYEFAYVGKPDKASGL